MRRPRPDRPLQGLGFKDLPAMAALFGLLSASWDFRGPEGLEMTEMEEAQAEFPPLRIFLPSSRVVGLGFT